MNKVCIIGLGKLGSHLYYSLNRTAKYRVSYIVKNSKSKILPADFNNCDTVFICTPDSKISMVVNELTKSEYKPEKKYIFHTSGAFDSGLLKQLEVKGARTGSFHPVQTFESVITSYNNRFRGIYIAIEGSTSAVKRAREIARMLGAKPVILTNEEKLLHHINSVIASNYLVVFFHIIEKLSQLIPAIYDVNKRKVNGYKKSSFFDIYKPLIEQTQKNIEKKGTVKSLTGPIARNDIRTINSHIRAIRNKIPELLPFYTLLGTEAVKLAFKNKSIKETDAKTLLKELNKSGFVKRKRKN